MNTSLGDMFITNYAKRLAEKVNFIAVEPGARDKARKFARIHGGRVYRAVAVGKVYSKSTAQDLGRGYIVALSPPRGFVFWRNYWGKIMEPQEMSKSDRHRYIIALGIDAFENRENFISWFKMPNRVLGGKTPASLVNTLEGAQEVFDELWRIAYGVFA